MTERLVLDYATARADLEEIVREQGDVQDRTGIYGTEDGEYQPNCLVGAILYKRMSFDQWHHLVDFFNWVSFDSLVSDPESPVEADGPTTSLLGIAQMEQDSGKTWHQSFDTAVAETEGAR